MVNDDLDFGNEGPKDAEKGKQGKEKSIDEKMLLSEFLKLKNELEELKKQKTPQVTSFGGGLSPEQFAEIVKMLKEKPDSEQYGEGKYVNEASIKPEDYDSQGTTFCAYSTGMVIVDDIRAGHPVQTPFKNKIIFDFQATKKYKNSDGRDEISTFCAYTSHSKMEIEWLRKHRFYGVLFFESAKEALSVDVKKAQKMMHTLGAISTLDQHAVISRCRENSIPVVDDLQKMKIMLASRIVEKEMAIEENQNAIRTTQAAEEKFFTASK